MLAASLSLHSFRFAFAPLTTHRFSCTVYCFSLFSHFFACQFGRLMKLTIQIWNSIAHYERDRARRIRSTLRIRKNRRPPISKYQLSHLEARRFIKMVFRSSLRWDCGPFGTRHVNEYLHSIFKAGQRYGMELHWKKFQVLPVQCSSKIVTPDGSAIPSQAGMDYLGTVLYSDGAQGHELNRRIGCAKADFLSLSKIWTHSACTWHTKPRIYNSLIESKLLYSLSSLCLTAAELRRLDGFQNRCIREMLGIKPSYLSRISNAIVLEKAGHPAAILMLQKRQLQLFGKITYF